jgi:hypothetical protein
MIRRLVPGVLVVSLLSPASAFANLRESIDREAARFVEQQAATRNPNPYKKTSLVLMGAGAGLLVLGLVQDRGAEVSTNRTGTAVTVQEKGGSKTALTVLGILTAGGGAALYAIGESKRSAQFGIWGSPSQIGVRSTIGF